MHKSIGQSAAAVLSTLMLLISVTARADQFEDGLAASQRGDHATTMKLWRPLAEQGNTDAQTGLGFIYARGDGVPQDYKEAANWFRKAADQGDPTAQNRLGVLYANGQGVQQNYKEAMTWFRKAAEQGQAESQYYVGIMYSNGDGVAQDFKQAFEWHRKAADQGFSRAQNHLGMMYARGQGVPQDYIAAVNWYRKAADQGNAASQVSLGVMYANGQGVPQDFKEATNWYLKAAEQGNARAQNNLGMMYENGQGVPQDYRESVKWFRKAAEQGDADAQNALGSAHAQGKGVSQDYKEATKWFRRAAEQGNAIAQYYLGLIYDKGDGVPQDVVRAHLWLNLSAASLSGEKGKIAADRRNAVAAKMTPAQIEQAQELARKCQQSDYKECDPQPKTSPPAQATTTPPLTTGRAQPPLPTTISYGSRAGMEVTVLGMDGRDTAKAVIRTKHTRENATAFCRDYVQKVTEKCIQETLAIRLNSQITANCVSGEFTNFRGDRYRFLGLNPKLGEFIANKYFVMNLATREIADGSVASGYFVNLGLYKALCPAHAPSDI